MQYIIKFFLHKDNLFDCPSWDENKLHFEGSWLQGCMTPAPDYL